MQKTRDFHKLHRPRRIAQRLQNIACLFRHRRYMSKAVLCKAQGRQRLIRALNIGADRRIVFHIFISEHSHPLFCIKFRSQNIRKLPV